jgi:hypothetical protein
VGEGDGCRGESSNEAGSKNEGVAECGDAWMEGLEGVHDAGVGSVRGGSRKGQGPQCTMVLSLVDDVGGETGQSGQSRVV